MHMHPQNIRAYKTTTRHVYRAEAVGQLGLGLRCAHVACPWYVSVAQTFSVSGPLLRITPVSRSEIGILHLKIQYMHTGMRNSSTGISPFFYLFILFAVIEYNYTFVHIYSNLRGKNILCFTYRVFVSS